MRSSIALTVGAFAASVSAIATISAKGSKFFTSDGNQFFIKGVAYQLTTDDPLIDGEQCALDSALMKTLGANAIRVYHVDPNGDHSSCMETFANAGIYLFVDMDTFTTYINPDVPAWNQTGFESYAAVMDEFQQFDNTAGFFVGNEVLTTGSNSIAAPYVKAAARDLKAHRDSKGYRNIPVGYSAADISSLRPNLQNYLACGDPSDALDFFSLNAYEWCGAATYETSGYVNLNEEVTNYSIPIFFSETGCNTAPPRTFGDQDAIFGAEMSPYWSGSIIYEWIEETNDYGLISYGPPAAATATDAIAGYTRSGTPTPVQPDFSNLSQHWATITPSSVSAAAYTPSNSAPACPAYTSGVWMVDGNAALPTIGQTYGVEAAAASSAGSPTSSAASQPSSAVGGGSSVTSQAPSATSQVSSQVSSAASSVLSVTSQGSTAIFQVVSGSTLGSASGSASAGSTSRSASGTVSEPATGASTGAATSATQTGMGSPTRKIAGMSMGLVTVMLGFIWWL